MQSPRLHLLGDVHLQGANGQAPTKSAVALELVAFLALYPSDTPHALDEALWPGTRANPNTRRQTLLRARKWVGTQPGGAPWVCHAEEGFRMAEGFEVDWHDMVDLAPPGALATTDTSDLATAVKLIGGRPFAGVNPVRYVWAELLHQQIVEHTQAVAVELLSREGFTAPGRVLEVTTRALEVDVSHEGLWCDHLTALMRTGNTHRLRSALGRAHAHLSGFDPSPATVQVMQDADLAIIQDLGTDASVLTT